MRARILGTGVAAVAALVIGISGYAFGVGRTTAGRAGATASSTALVDSAWRLTGVRTGRRTYPVPAGYAARLGFAAHGRFTGRDGANGLAGAYRTSGDRVTIALTAAGTAGSTRTFAAQQAMMSVYEATASTSGNRVTSTFVRTAHNLTLDTGRWTLTFTELARDPTAPTAPASATASAR